ncbi:MAG: SMI1/KNR4 family protein [Planctomycetota bacterium]
MSPRVLEIINLCDLHPGASDADLARLSDLFGAALPTDYAELLRYTNGCEGDLGSNWFNLFSVETACLYNQKQNDPLYPAWFKLIASNGGGEAHGYDVRTDPWTLANVPFLFEEQLVRPLARSIEEFILRLHTRPLFD